LGAAEWVMNNKNIRLKEYSCLQQLYNPQAFGEQKWVTIAKEAGMQYITYITRHYD